jgi:phage baseplate assembly protein W
MVLYRGYSTVNRDFGPYRITDNDLIIQDLLNNFNIRRGEKLMNPEFGCIIWDRLFEPLTIGLKDEILTNIQNIINNDPRLNVVSGATLQESPDGHGLIVVCSLAFNNSDQVTTLQIKFDSQAQRLYLL